VTNDAITLLTGSASFPVPLLLFPNLKGTDMEIINIEKKAYETMMARFDRLTAKVQAFCSRYDEKRLKTWYDNQDVCQLLRISPRKLQFLRDNGTLPFVKINRKIFYKPEDVQNIITAGNPKNSRENNTSNHTQ
jgi:hypothetical protein